MTITAVETQTTSINIRLIGDYGILGNITFTRNIAPEDAYDNLYELLQHAAVRYREFDFDNYSELQIDVWESNRKVFNKIKQAAKKV